MKSKNSLLFISAATLFLSLIFTACTQNSRSQKKGKPADVVRNEEAGQIIKVQVETDTLKGSLKAEAQGSIGSATVKIRYYSPAVRGRVVWGELVPYDQVWVTGAHNATSLQSDKDLTIAGKKIPAGKYALFTIPGKNEWVIIINKNWQQHLADNYSEKEDMFRIKIKPGIHTENQERLRYEVVSDAGSTGQIVMTWGKLKLAIPVKH